MSASNDSPEFRNKTSIKITLSHVHNRVTLSVACQFCSDSSCILSNIVISILFATVL